MTVDPDDNDDFDADFDDDFDDFDFDGSTPLADPDDK